MSGVDHLRSECLNLRTDAGNSALEPFSLFHGAIETSSDRDGGGQAIVMVVALVLLILAPILAQFIYFALSRRREYLADASGAMFTRYPEGLASALEKISGSNRPLADTR